MLPRLRALSPATWIVLILAFGATVDADTLSPVVRPGQGDALDPAWVRPVVARRDDVADSALTAYGATSPFASVGRISGSFTASGVLIAPDWVLTAAHAVPSASTTYSFTVGGNTYTAVERILLMPDFDPSNGDDYFAGNDLALLRLDAPVTNVTPAVLSARSDEVGQQGAIAGFGRPGTGSGGPTGNSGTRRAADNAIDVTGDYFSNVSSTLLVSDFDSPTDSTQSWFGSTSPLALEGMITTGDSGGGLFADFGNGLELVGIHSFVVDEFAVADFGYGTLGFSVRVSSHRDWILQTVPEPSSVLLVALGAVGLAGAAARRARRPA